MCNEYETVVYIHLCQPHAEGAVLGSNTHVGSVEMLYLILLYDLKNQDKQEKETRINIRVYTI